MNGHQIHNTDFDADGFMSDMSNWGEALARQIATSDGLGDLDDEQIALLKQLRESYARAGALPAVSHVCHLGGLEPDCMTRLFPSLREVWRLVQQGWDTSQGLCRQTSFRMIPPSAPALDVMGPRKLHVVSARHSG